MSNQKKVGQEVLEHFPPLSTNTISTGMVSPTIAPSGTPSSNTTNHRADGAVVGHQVLLQGIDTLSVTAGGVSAPSVWLQENSLIWNEYQQQYQSPDDYLCIEFDDKWWQLYPHGNRPYKYQFRNDEVGMIRVWNTDKWSGGVDGKQHIHIHFYSKYLHSFTISQLNDEVRRIVSKFFDSMTGVIIQVSRVDLHSDVSSKSMLSMDDVSNSISRCKVRDYHLDDNTVELSGDEVDLISSPLTNNKGEQKLIPVETLEKLYRMYNNQLTTGCNRVMSKRDLETAYWGNKSGGDVWGKVYNKSKQVITKNDDDTPLLWEENGWNKEDVVIRVEFSMRRNFLKTLDDGKYVTLQSFLQGIDVVWKYFTEKWLRLVEEVKHNNSTWSLVTPFWKCVTGAFREVAHTIIRVKSYKAKINQLWLQGIGCLKQMISLGMNTNDEMMFYKSTIQAVDLHLNRSYRNREFLERRMLLGIA